MTPEHPDNCPDTNPDLDNAQGSKATEAELLSPRRISPEKLAANRLNAQKSTGPRTAEGKARSRWNAVKHGVLSNRLIVFEAKDREVYNHLLESLCDELRPANAAESIIVEKIAMAYWRLHLAFGYEADLCRTPGRFLHSCDRTGRYANTIHRQLLQDLAQLERLQRRRNGEVIPAPISVNLNVSGEPAESPSTTTLDLSEIAEAQVAQIESKISTTGSDFAGGETGIVPEAFWPNKANSE